MRLRKIKRLKSLQYLVITATCYLFFMVQTYEALLEYFSKKKGTRTMFKPITQAEFPAFTTCPISWSAYNSDEIAKHGISDTKQYMNEGIWISNNSNTSPEILYNKIVINMSKVMEKMAIKLRTTSINGKKRYDLKPTDKVW